MADGVYIDYEIVLAPSQRKAATVLNMKHACRHFTRLSKHRRVRAFDTLLTNLSEQLEQFRIEAGLVQWKACLTFGGRQEVLSGNGTVQLDLDAYIPMRDFKQCMIYVVMAKASEFISEENPDTIWGHYNEWSAFDSVQNPQDQ
jgi:hypothetical protein